MVDVAVHADRAAVDHAACAGARGRCDDVCGRLGVDGAIVPRRYAGLPINGGDVVDDFDVPSRQLQRLGASKIAGGERHLVPAVDAAELVRVGDERLDVMAARHEIPRKVAARESRCAGYEYAHRSATSVTGEPNTRSSPA